MVKRDVGIDLVKVWAIFCVVVIHTCNYELAVGSRDWIVNIALGTFVRGGVPLFLMASGAVMLEPQKTIILKKLYLKNILRIITAMVFWGIAYKIYRLFDAGALSMPNVWQAVKEVLVFNQEFHFYYIHIILIVYIFVPITRIIIKNAGKRELQYLLAVWFVFAVLYPTLKPFWPFSLFGGFTVLWEINMVYAAIGYGILGYYLKKYAIAKGWDVFLAVAGFLFIFLTTVIISLRRGYLYEHFLSGMSLGTAALAVGSFCFLNRIKITGKRVESAVIWLSKASFCIYLVHMLVIYFMKRAGITAELGPDIISIPLMAVITIAFSCIVYFVISKLPVANKWII